MSNGSWQGVSESSPQPEVDGEEPQAGYSSAMEPVKEAAEDENGIDDNEGNKKVVEGACADRLEMTDDGEEEDEDDDPLVQELKAELERTAFRQSSFGQQHVAKEKTPHEPPSSSSQAHYTSKIAALMETMDDDQLNRFEAFRRSTLSRASMKKLVSSLINQTMNDEKVNIVLCSLGKMFVGDLVETARGIANAEQHVGPLTRSHVYQAYKAIGKKNRRIKRRAGRFFGRL